MTPQDAAKRSEDRVRFGHIVQAMIRDAAAEQDGDWAVSFKVLPTRVFKAIDAAIAEATKERDARLAEAREALEKAEEALDFAVGALGDAVERELDTSAGYAVIRMVKDARRLHIKPLLTRLRDPEATG